MKKYLILVLLISLVMLSNAQTSGAEKSVLVAINILLLTDDNISPSTEQNVSMAWSAPLQREDNSSLSAAEIDHYQIRYRKNGAGSYRFLLIYPPSLTATLRLRGEPGDEYELSIRAVDSQGLSSSYTGSHLVTVGQ